MIFAAKTTASALLALLVAFTFNLDQPQWALLTVFIVSQPQSGLVLAKSFMRPAFGNTTTCGHKHHASHG